MKVIDGFTEAIQISYTAYGRFRTKLVYKYTSHISHEKINRCYNGLTLTNV